MASDHYHALGVKHDASPQDILAAYRAKAAKLHPDAGGSPYTWAAIQAAYDTLIDRDARAAYDGCSNDDDDSEEEWEEDEYSTPWYSPLEPFDLLVALGLSVNAEASDVVGGATRCRACFYKQAQHRRPWEPDQYASVDEYATAVLQYRRACVAFLALRDAERRALYLSGGYERLAAAEAYQETSIFDADPDQVVADFFAGVDADDREFLLFNGKHSCARAHAHPHPSLSLHAHEPTLARASACLVTLSDFEDSRFLAQARTWPTTASTASGCRRGGTLLP